MVVFFEMVWMVARKGDALRWSNCNQLKNYITIYAYKLEIHSKATYEWYIWFIYNSRHLFYIKLKNVIL